MAKEMAMTKVEDNSTGTKVKRGVLGVIINLILWFFSLTCMFPLVWMLYSSLKEKRVFNADIVGLPKEPTLANYIKILSNKDYKLMQSVGNSARTTILSVLLIVLTPIHSLMVPIYIIFSRLGLSDHWYTLLMPYVSFALPMSIFLVEGYVKGIPTELEEAAAIDGSTFSKTLFGIILPVCKLILVTVAIINVFSCWNEFSFALILIKQRALYTVPLGLKQFTGQFTSDYLKIMAAMLMTMAPIVIFYFAFSKQIIKGMVAGAVKG